MQNFNNTPSYNVFTKVWQNKKKNHKRAQKKSKVRPNVLAKELEANSFIFAFRSCDKNCRKGAWRDSCVLFKNLELRKSSFVDGFLCLETLEDLCDIFWSHFNFNYFLFGKVNSFSNAVRKCIRFL